MGFNKRYISKESLLSVYRNNGIDGVKTHLRSADALFYSDSFSGQIVDMYNEIGFEIKIDPWRDIETEIKNELPN